MRVALIQPDSPYLSYPLAFPNLGLLYVSAYLKRRGVDHEFYDLTGGIEMSDIEADVIAFSCQITQWKQVLKLKKKLKAKKFIIGGPFPTFSPEVCRKEGFSVVRGNLPIPLDMFPNWDAIDLSRYGYGLEGKRCINVMTKQGSCPYHCAFCAKVKSPLKFRTVENVLAECAELKERGFGAIAFYDDDMLINKKRDEKIFDGLANLHMPYRCMTRTDLATWQDLKMLKDTGCAEVAIGVETANFKLKMAINKGTTIAQDTHFVKTCKKLGLRVKAYLIIGLPGETIETISETRTWLKMVNPDNFDISVLTPYPGSDIYDHKEKYDIDWDEETLQEMWFSGEAQYGNCAVRTSALTSKEILYFKQALEKEFKRGTGGKTSYWGPL